MKNKHNYQAVISAKATLSSVNVGLLYSFMIKRIAKGYSTSEVSFLMGHHTDYIKQKEELISIGFTFEDMHCFRQAVEEKSLTGLISNFEDLKTMGSYQLLKTSDPIKTEIKMIRFEKDGREIPIFHLVENNKMENHSKISEQQIAAEVTAKLNVLFEGQMFYKPQSPLQIYQECRNTLSETLAPRHLQAALLTLTKKKDFPKLKRIKSKDHGSMYEKVFD
ncbi:hypothetical protein [Pedobacter gandavensis]|uniref:RepB family plasmid replication initiator protein n=1 Tax=Pedobacter gandavensis TaxID=2679963 RepID=A0ABR6F2I3_9SPHI|nr:hypothetical protein [Pedobacter gandavensis]MBB2151734.1 hypothetical protein [Pedobacter gandavensis]